MKKLLPLLAIPVFVVGIAACGDKYTEPFKDAPVSSHDNSPAVIHHMPDGFGNFATKCVGKDEWGTLYHGNSAYGSLTVAVNSPNCP